MRVKRNNSIKRRSGDTTITPRKRRGKKGGRKFSQDQLNNSRKSANNNKVNVESSPQAGPSGLSTSQQTTQYKRKRNSRGKRKQVQNETNATKFSPRVTRLKRLQAKKRIGVSSRFQKYRDIANQENGDDEENKIPLKNEFQFQKYRDNADQEDDEENKIIIPRKHKLQFQKYRTIASQANSDDEENTIIIPSTNELKRKMFGEDTTFSSSEGEIEETLVPKDKKPIGDSVITIDSDDDDNNENENVSKEQELTFDPKSDAVNSTEKEIVNLEEKVNFYEDTTPGVDFHNTPTYMTIDEIGESSVILVEPTLDDGEIRDNDTLVNQVPLPPKKRRLDSDDSVIFCPQEIEIVDLDADEKPLDYISLLETFKKSQKLNPHKKKKFQANVTPTGSQPKLTPTNAQVDLTDNKRMIVIDGSNVAFSHSIKRQFSVKGIDICIQYFKKMGHEVKAVIPQFRMKKAYSTDQARLDTLFDEGLLTLTPCKNLPGGKNSASYDDRFILQIAAEFDAVVISNDNFRDLSSENEKFKTIIEKSVVGYTWVNDMLLIPEDPYGRNGPKLNQILCKPAKK